MATSIQTIYNQIRSSDPLDSSIKEHDVEFSDDSSESHLIPKSTLPKRRQIPWMLVAIPWALNVFLVFMTIYLWTQMPKNTQQLHDGAYSTEFGPVKHLIELEEVVFTGGPAYDENGTMFVPNPSKIDYIGDPSPNIDDAWNDLIEGRYIIITEDEARAQWPSTYREFYHPERRGYVAGTDMFHTLHCLNNIRKAFHSDYYDVHYEKKKVHMNHCIDQLRQYVMCAGDMTPIPTKYYPGKGRNYVLSDVPHTCRKFDTLREWQYSRYVGGDLEVLPDAE